MEGFLERVAWNLGLEGCGGVPRQSGGGESVCRATRGNEGHRDRDGTGEGTVFQISRNNYRKPLNDSRHGRSCLDWHFRESIQAGCLGEQIREWKSGARRLSQGWRGRWWWIGGGEIDRGNWGRRQ